MQYKEIIKSYQDFPIEGVKKTGVSVLLEEIRNYPTRYKCSDGNYYKTHEVNILWEQDNEL